MSVRISFDHDAWYILAAFDGPISETELTEALHSITSSTEHAPNVNVLWDLRGAGFHNVTRRVVRRLDAVRRQYDARAGARSAVVVPDDLGFGILRMIEAYGSDIPVTSSIFRTMEEADDWLRGPGL